MKRTFRGGIRPDPRKRATLGAPLEALEPPALLIVPLALREGTDVSADVKPGDSVKVGTRLGTGEVPVYSPVSGLIRAISERQLPTGGSVPVAEIENDGLDDPDPFTRSRGSLETLSPEEIIELSYTAGLVLTGTDETVYERLRSLMDSACETLIIDCTECDPYVTSRRRTLLDRTDEVLAGVRLFMKALSPKQTVLALCSDSYDVAERLTKRVSKTDPMTLAVLPAKYPQGNVRRLIDVIADGRANTTIVLDPESAAELYRAAATGAPQLTRSVTVAGDAVANPKNLLVRIGTPIYELIEAAGGLRRDPLELIYGGSMDGVSLKSADFVVTAVMDSLLVLSQKAAATDHASACIRCGRCVAACPERLEPLYISLYLKHGADTELIRTGADRCIECGSCAYVCPAKIPLTEHVRLAKRRIASREKVLKEPVASDEIDEAAAPVETDEIGETSEPTETDESEVTD